MLIPLLTAFCKNKKQKSKQKQKQKQKSKFQRHCEELISRCGETDFPKTNRLSTRDQFPLWSASNLKGIREKSSSTLRRMCGDSLLDPVLPDKSINCTRLQIIDGNNQCEMELCNKLNRFKVLLLKTFQEKTRRMSYQSVRLLLEHPSNRKRRSFSQVEDVINHGAAAAAVVL